MDGNTRFESYAAEEESALPSTYYQRDRTPSNGQQVPRRKPSREQNFGTPPTPQKDYDAPDTSRYQHERSASNNGYQANVSSNPTRSHRPTNSSNAGSGSYKAGSSTIPSAGYQAGSSTIPSSGHQAGGSTITSSGYQAGGSTIPSSDQQKRPSRTASSGQKASRSASQSKGYQAGGSTISSSGYKAGGSTIPISGYQAGGSTIPSSGYQAGGSTIPSSGYQAGGSTILSGGYQAGSSTIPTSEKGGSSQSFARYDSDGAPLPKFDYGDSPGAEEKAVAVKEKGDISNNYNAEPTAVVSGPKWTLLFASLCLAVLCQALDNTILATAIPRITDDFNSLNDVGWYGASYLLTTCAFQLSYGKLYNFFPIKWVFLIALGIFEAGSLLCGAAPTSIALILGRCIAGVGSGGVFSGALLIIAQAQPLAKRPIFNGCLGSMYAVASIAGPLMGGAFTDRVTWRLCFYINLPLGFVTAVCVFFFLPANAGKNDRWDMPFMKKLGEIDLLGLGILIPAIVCALLALQWGGSTYPWGNWRIILLLVFFVLLIAGFVAVQILKGDKATVPPSAIKQRTIWSCCIFSFFLFGSFLSITYYLPIWFQAIKGDTATQSGIDNLPSILGTVIFSIVAGGMVFGIGYYTWAMILASILSAIGAGLISTFTVDTNSSKWIGYQVIYGAGIGIGLQQPLIAVQTALPDYQVAEGTAIIIFIQSFGGSVMIAAAGNVFNNKLIQNVIAARLPVNPADLLTAGATQLSRIVPAESLPALRLAYNQSLTQTFYVTVATAALSLLGSVFIPWLSVKKEKAPAAPVDEENQDRDGMEMSDRSSSHDGAVSATSGISIHETKPVDKEMDTYPEAPPQKPEESYSVKDHRFSSFTKKDPNGPANDARDKQHQKEMEHYKKDFNLHENNAQLYDKKVRLYDKNVELYERNIRLYDANSRLYDKSVSRYEDSERGQAYGSAASRF